MDIMAHKVAKTTVSLAFDIFFNFICLNFAIQAKS